MWVQAGDKKKWRAMIQHNHEQHHVGYYPTAEEAARAYDRKALLFMGPSAITNFPAADYDGVNLEADGSVEEQVETLHWPSDSTQCLGAEKYLSCIAHLNSFVTRQHNLRWFSRHSAPCLELHIVACWRSAKFHCMINVGMHLADEEAEEDKDVAVQGGHQGGSQVEGGHQDE